MIKANYWTIVLILSSAMSLVVAQFEYSDFDFRDRNRGVENYRVNMKPWFFRDRDNYYQRNDYSLYLAEDISEDERCQRGWLKVKVEGRKKCMVPFPT